MTLVSNGVYQGPRAAGLTALAISQAPFAAVIRHHKSGSGSGLGLARVRFRLRVERVRIRRVRVSIGLVTNGVHKDSCAGNTHCCRRPGVLSAAAHTLHKSTRAIGLLGPSPSYSRVTADCVCAVGR